MQLRAIIVDDEDTGIDNLRLTLERYAPQVRVIACSTQPREAVTLIEDYRPDVVFLDISMPEMDGFEMLNRLIWKNFCLIFITAHQEFGLKALKQNAIDYLLKPIDHRELLQALDRAVARLTRSAETMDAEHYRLLRSVNTFSTNKLAIVSKNTVESVLPADIVCLESRSNYTCFSLVSSKTIVSPKTLKDYEDLLCDNIMFMRVHHSYIINLQMIQRYLKEKEMIVMRNGQSIHLSRNRKGRFIQWLDTDGLR